ncbi:MAG: hypothetical protein ACE364_06890 [Chlorobiota bacterium]
MAIYQFYLAALPRKGVLEHFGKIPNRLKIDFQKSTEQFLSKEIEDEFDYFEFIQHICWEIAKINSEEIIYYIDKKLDRANWGNNKECFNWKKETQFVDNDCWILINPEKNLIKEFTFRADLRQTNLKFLFEMVELAKEREFLLVDRLGNLIEPELENVKDLINKSKV